MKEAEKINKIKRDVKGRFTSESRPYQRLDLPEKEIINSYLNRESLNSIARRLNCSRTAIQRVMKENDIEIRKGSGLDEKEILKLYLKEEITPQEIAKKFKCSTNPIYRILNKNNVISKKLLFKYHKNTPPKNKVILTKDEENNITNLYVKEKKCASEIVKIIGLPIAVIYRVLKDNQIKRRKGKYIFNDKEIINDYLNLGKSCKKIAREKKCDSNVIEKILRRNNIKIKKSGIKSERKGLTLKEYYGEDRWRDIRNKYIIHRAKQIFPVKDTSIEVKIQNFLKQLGIEFFTHQYIKEIEHGYQCDILIPSMNLVIECDGNYWHKYPIGNEIDHVRTSELLQKGFKVLRLWEHEIRNMKLNDLKERLKDV